jgi:hypothetical protein
MGALDRLFGRQKEQQPPDEPDQECTHGVLVPHWDSVDDIGKDDRVMWYRCQSCYAMFSREEGERLMAEAADRLMAEEPAETRQSGARQV